MERVLREISGTESEDEQYCIMEGARFLFRAKPCWDNRLAQD